MQVFLILAILGMGFSGIVAQVVLLRELLISFLGNELSIGIILSNWLILEAFGSYLLGKHIEKQKNRICLFVIGQVFFSILFPVAVYLSRTIKTILDVSPGEAVGIFQILAASFFILSLVSIIHGALFTCCCSLYNTIIKDSQNGRSIGKVYIYETMGTLIGGVLITYFLIPHFHALNIAFGIAILNLTICLILLKNFGGRASVFNKLLWMISGVVLCLFLLIMFANLTSAIHKDSIKRQWHGQNVLYYQNSIYGNVVVTKNENQYTFYSDGIPIITTPVPDITFVEEFVHLPMLYHPAPKEILIISAGAGGVLSEILKYPVNSIDYVELDPLILRAIRKFPTTLTETEFSSLKVHPHYLDGRYYIRNTDNSYDLIFIGLSNPQDLQTNRLFTREFFGFAKAKLKPEGILVIKMPGSLTYLSNELKNLNRCILNTLADVFGHLKIIPGDGLNLYLASDCEENFLVSTQHLSQKLVESGLKFNLLTPKYLEYKLHPRWIDWFSKSIEDGTDKMNTDFRPLGVFYSLAYWNALFSPDIQRLYEYLERIDIKLIFIITTILTLFFIAVQMKIKRLAKTSIPICIITTGFAGLLFNLVLLFAFQTVCGYLFYWVGIIVSVLMFGITTGGYIATALLGKIRHPLRFLFGTEIMLIIFSIFLPLIFLIGNLSAWGKIPFLILAFIAGLLIGLEFPLANRIYLSFTSQPDLGHTAGLLYGADLFGGWLGGMLAGIALLPVLGLLATSIVVTLFKLNSLIVLIVSRPRLGS